MLKVPNPNFPLMKDFQKWFNSWNNTSAASYQSYLAKIIDCVCPLLTFELDNKTISSQEIATNIHRFLKNKEGREFVLLFIINLDHKIDEVKVHITDKRKKQDIYNSRSALRAYKSYIEFLCYEENESMRKAAIVHPLADNRQSLKFNKDEAKSLSNQLSRDYENVYTQVGLKNIFASRLVTQRRRGGNYAVELDMDFIAKNIPDTEKISLRGWASEFVKGAKIIIDEKGTSVTLDEVSTLSIMPTNQVKVELKNNRKEYKVLTEIYDPSKSEKKYLSFDQIYKKKERLEIKDLALDHDTPIFQILKNLKAQLPTLSKFRGNTQQGLTDKEKDNLWREFILIHDYVSFTLMYQLENVKKGKDEDSFSIACAIEKLKRMRSSLEVCGGTEYADPDSYTAYKAEHKNSSFFVTLSFRDQPFPVLKVSDLIKKLDRQKDKNEQLKVCYFECSKKVIAPVIDIIEEYDGNNRVAMLKFNE